MNNNLYTALSQLLANTYALYLKTQNYHWHVKGPNFKPFHLLFEEQYTALATAIDDIAERILTLGKTAPASFNEFNKLKAIEDGDPNHTPNQMIIDLYHDHQKIIDDLNSAIKLCQEDDDEGTIALLSERIAAHQKIQWMLGASREQ